MLTFATRTLRAHLPARFAKLVARFSAARCGTVAVEFGLIAIPFFLIIMATVQTAIVYMAEQELETITEQSSRYILTNKGENYTQTTFAKNVVCKQVVALFNCDNLMIDLEDYGTGTSFSDANTSMPKLTFDASGGVQNKWSYTSGSPGDIMVLRIMYQWPIFLKPFAYNLSNLANGNRLMMATAVFKDEP
ncbi:MAG: TadE/TadG family type IV pilus assembly protein [Bradyrhizobium sp.]